MRHQLNGRPVVHSRFRAGDEVALALSVLERAEARPTLQCIAIERASTASRGPGWVLADRDFKGGGQPSYRAPDGRLWVEQPDGTYDAAELLGGFNWLGLKLDGSMTAQRCTLAIVWGTAAVLP